VGTMLMMLTAFRSTADDARAASSSWHTHAEQRQAQGVVNDHGGALGQRDLGSCGQLVGDAGLLEIGRP
jgi:hypothetical protein